MRKRAAVLLPLLFCPAAFGQLDSNSITVSASANATPQPDQVVFSLSVGSGINTGFDDILAALQGLGITAANFSSVSTEGQTIATLGTAISPTPAPALVWFFTLPAPLANTKATVASLAALQQNFTQQNNGLTLSFSVTGTQVSQQLVQSQPCSIAGLITAATTQAQSLAAASGFTLGGILALSSSTPSPCAITVKFNVTRN
jgi:hypothetical protein